MGKKVLCLIFVLLFSINTFAAVVTDNDGAAFITKAEFDSMKNDFQSQLNEYNTQIDNKIDGAISTYLSGIKRLNKDVRAKATDANSWTFYSSVDYPKYTEGYPYIEGSSVRGHANMGSLYGTHNVTWSGFIFPGVAAYKTNGGFRKHYIDKVFQKNNQIGGNRYYGEYAGYWIDEGEYIHIGGWSGSLSSGTWAHSWERTLTPYQTNSFANRTVPATAWGQWCHYVSDEDKPRNPGNNGGSTTINIIVQAAERINGKQNVGTATGVYSDISDSRFYNINTSNRIGISDCSPQIAKGGSGSTFTTWFNIACAGVRVNYSSHRLERNGGSDTVANARWYDHGYPATGHWGYDLIVDGHFDSSLYQSFLKLANDPNNFQFKYLWSPQTNAAAVKLDAMLSDPSVSSSMKSNIRNILIYDNSNIPHISMIAGFPFLEVKRNETVSWDFTVSGSSNVAVVGRYGPFSPSGDPATQADVLFETTSGGVTTYNTVFTGVPGRTNTIKFKVLQDGIVFLKWTKNGGGTMTLDTSKDADVEWEA